MAGSDRRGGRAGARLLPLGHALDPAVVAGAGAMRERRSGRRSPPQAAGAGYDVAPIRPLIDMLRRARDEADPPGARAAAAAGPGAMKKGPGDRSPGPFVRA